MIGCHVKPKLLQACDALAGQATRRDSLVKEQAVVAAENVLATFTSLGSQRSQEAGGAYLKPFQVRVNVESEAVCSNPAARVQANGCNLAS